MEPKFRVIYYISPSGEKPIGKFLDSLDQRSQSKILRIFQYIKEFGIDSVKKHIKKLSGTLFGK